jgi:hypothetical protein
MKTKSFKSFFVEQERISVLTEDVIYMEAIVDWFSRSESILKESLFDRFRPVFGALTGSSAGSRDAADITTAAAGAGAKKVGGGVVELVDAALTFSPKTIFTGIVTILKTVQDTQEFANSARNALSLIHIKETLRKQFEQNKYDKNTINDILNYYFEIPHIALQVYRMHNSGYVLSKAVDAFKDEITKGFDLNTTKTFFKIFKQEVIKNVSELNQTDRKIEIRLLDNEEKDIATKLEPKVKQALSSGGESVKKIFSNSLARSSNSSLKNMVSDLASFAARQGRNIALAGALGLGAIGALPQNAGDSAIPDAQVQQVQSQSAQENRAINAFKNRFTDASFSWGENAEQSKIIFKKIDYDQSGKVTVSGFVTIARNDRPMNKEDVRSWSELYKYRIGDAVDRALGYSFSKDMTDGPSFGEEFLFSHIKQNYKFHSPFHKTTNFKIGVNETEKLNQNPSLNSVAIPFSITVSR